MWSLDRMLVLIMGKNRGTASVAAGAMSPADIVEKARRRGVSLALNGAGTGLSLSGVGAPPQDLIDLIRDAKDVLVVHLRQKRAIRAWINNSFTSGRPGVCLHCGGRWLADEPVIMVWCGTDYGEVHEAFWEAWEAEQGRRARKAPGFV
jgi:hypothetical protein